jgi:FkbM family methyltransferase
VLGAMWSRFALLAARSYVRRFPRARGTSRLLAEVERRVVPRLPPDFRVVVRCADGRRFVLNARDPAAFNLIMIGTYDPRETVLLRRLLRPGDVCVDIGANDGWYSTLMARLVGPHGRVHAFEPSPITFELLERNCRTNGPDHCVVRNLLALGEQPGTAVIHVPPHHGAASLRAGDDEPCRPFECRVETLDGYCAAAGVRRIRLVKCDVEGSELQVLRGARSLLDGPEPPMWLMELNRRTAQRFGWQPADMLRLLAERGYVFHVPIWKPLGRLRPLKIGDSFVDGENALCSIPRLHGRVDRQGQRRGG